MSSSNSHESRYSNGEDSTHTLDLTTGRSDSSAAASMPADLHYTHPHRRNFRPHTSFNSAYHRIVSRQEREYDRTNPSIIRERIDVAEEHSLNPIRERALVHTARAYIAVGYTHATLTIIICAICAALLLAVSYSVASDVSRKTRDRAANLVSSAAECAVSLKTNHCVIDGDHVSHASHELAALCKQWFQCAKRGQFADSDARSAKVWAETLADITNTFTERLSTASVVTIAVGLFIFSVFFRSSYSFLHRRIVDDSIMASEPSFSSQHQTPLLTNSPTPHDRPRRPSRYIGYRGHSPSTSRQS